MALPIQNGVGPDIDHLLRMQLAYDVARTRQHASDIAIKRYVSSLEEIRLYFGDAGVRDRKSGPGAPDFDFFSHSETEGLHPLYLFHLKDQRTDPPV